MFACECRGGPTTSDCKNGKPACVSGEGGEEREALQVGSKVLTMRSKRRTDEECGDEWLILT